VDEEGAVSMSSHVEAPTVCLSILFAIRWGKSNELFFS
jgi:hypothetical protein